MSLHQDGDGRVTNFIKRINQIEQNPISLDDKIRQGVAATR